MFTFAPRVASALAVAVMFVVGLVPLRSAQAQGYQTIDDGSIHEAYVSPVTGVTALQAVPKAPPPPILERIPPQCEPDAVWIKGYWEYDPDDDEFDWVSGTWRREPRGRVWIDGFWVEFDEGWIRVHGFWSDVPQDRLVYIDEPPPDPMDEEVPDAPGDDYFWLAGHAAYDYGRRVYVQYSGHWEPMDPNLVLTPAHFEWQPDGYVFVSAFWDFALERRGCAYKSIRVQPTALANIMYEPAVILEPTYVVGYCYRYYPNYVYFLHHHHHHHHAWWYDHYDAPPWWGWHSWWGLSWHDHWSVWHWYTHPGYAHPHFMTASLAARMHPASERILLASKKTKAPSIVTAVGVVAPSKAREAAVLSKVKVKEDDSLKGKKPYDKDKKDKFAPVLAAKPKVEEKVKEVGIKPPVSPLVPTGIKSAVVGTPSDPKSHPPKPTIKKTVESTTTTGKTGTPPPLIKGSDARTKGTEKLKGKTEEMTPRTKTGKTLTPPPIVEPKTKGFDKPKGKMEDTPKPKLGDDKPKPKLGDDKPKPKLADDKPKPKLADDKPKLKGDDRPKIKLDDTPKPKIEEKPKLRVEEKLKPKVEVRKPDPKPPAPGRGDDKGKERDKKKDKDKD